MRFFENVLKSAISRQAKASKLSLVLWLNEIVGFGRVFPYRPLIDPRYTFVRPSFVLRSDIVRTSFGHRSDIVREARSNEGTGVEKPCHDEGGEKVERGSSNPYVMVEEERDMIADSAESCDKLG